MGKGKPPVKTGGFWLYDGKALCGDMGAVKIDIQSIGSGGIGHNRQVHSAEVTIPHGGPCHSVGAGLYQFAVSIPENK